jgi:hypothetical protein
MDITSLRKYLPTFFSYWDRRREATRNRLPKHLRPPSKMPLFAQMAINLAIITALSYLMIYQDDFVTEAVPGIVLVVCTLMMFYTLIKAFEFKNRYKGLRGYHRWALLNFWLMWLAALFVPMTVVAFLP